MYSLLVPIGVSSSSLTSILMGDSDILFEDLRVCDFWLRVRVIGLPFIPIYMLMVCFDLGSPYSVLKPSLCVNLVVILISVMEIKSLQTFRLSNISE